jgi:hypothetical protein
MPLCPHLQDALALGDTVAALHVGQHVPDSSSSSGAAAAAVAAARRHQKLTHEPAALLAASQGKKTEQW